MNLSTAVELRVIDLDAQRMPTKGSADAPKEEGSAEGELSASREALTRFVITRQRLLGSLVQTPIALLCYSMITAALLVHMPSYRSYPVEKALVDSIVQPDDLGIVTDDNSLAFSSIGSRDDVFTWLSDTFIPMAFAVRDEVSHDKFDYAFDDAERSANLAHDFQSKRLLTYNRMLYGVHVKQTRFNKTLCDHDRLNEFVRYCYSSKQVSGSAYPYTDEMLFAQWMDDDDDDAGLAPAAPAPATTPGPSPALAATPATTPGPSLAPAAPVPATTPGPSPGGGDDDFKYQKFSAPRGNGTAVIDDNIGFWLPEFMAPYQLKTTLEVYKKARWLDPGSESVQIQMCVVNNELGVLVLLTLTVSFDRGGEVSTDYEISSVVSDAYDSIDGLQTAGVVFCLTMALPFFSRLNDIRRIKREGIALRAALVDFWAVVDVAQIVIQSVLISLWVKIQTDLSDAIGGINDIDDNARPETFLPIFMELGNILEDGGTVAQFLIAGFVCMGISMLFVLKCFRYHPELSLLTRTIARTMYTGIYFFIVFALVFVTYAVSGVFMFGGQLNDYADIGIMMTLFRMMLGDWDYDSLTAVNNTASWIFFVSFVVVVALILLNVLLAIVMDAYAEVKAELASELSVSQGELVSEELGRLFECCSKGKNDESRYVNFDRLCNTLVHGTLSEMDTVTRSQLIGLGISKGAAERLLSQVAGATTSDTDTDTDTGTEKGDLRNAMSILAAQNAEMARKLDALVARLTPLPGRSEV